MRTLLAPIINERTGGLVYECSDCTWLIALDRLDDGDAEEGRIDRVRLAFSTHTCSDYPRQH